MKKEAKSPQECQFEVDGKTYAFNAPQVEVNTGNGYRTLKAAELVASKDHADVLIHLVAIGSGVIKVIKKSKAKK